MDRLLSLWELHFIHPEPPLELCIRCRKQRLMTSFYDNCQRRRLCKECRDYNKKYCKKYFSKLNIKQ